jgi:isoleucyl-tRNA synthetase
MLQEVTRFYDGFSFHDVFHCVYTFCVVQLSSFYLDILKDRLYIFGTKSIQRRSAQTALFEILNVITKAMAPILVFTADEAWLSLTKKEGESVHLCDWPDAKRLAKFYDKALEEKWSALIRVREDVLKALELEREAGLIGSSLEAAVELYSSDTKLQQLLKKAQPVLNSVFIVSKVSVSDQKMEGAYQSGLLPLAVAVRKAQGEKCQRCWNYSETVGKDAKHPALCERCVNIVKGE